LDLAPGIIVLVTAAFFVAGSVKGLIGVGLPTVSIAILINGMPLRQAIPLIIAPAVISNVVQALSGGHLLQLAKRFWLLCTFTVLFTWVGVDILASSDQRLMSAIFGIVLTIYALTGLLRPAPRPLGASERWLTPAVGVLNGLINGLTGSYMLPSVIYLQSLGLTKDELIQAMGIFFLVAGTALGVSLAGQKVMSLGQTLISAAALVPALIGYYFGLRLRNRLSEERFRQIFFIGLLLLGIYTIARATI
jgi:uncharacterized membrane protein YfcA